MSRPDELAIDPFKSQETTASATSVLFIVLNLFLLLLLSISYIPQFCRLRTRQSTDGISLYFILLRAIYTSANLSSLLVLPEGFWRVVFCFTKRFTVGKCASETMTVWQVVLDWLLSQILLLLYLHYYNSNPRASAQNTVDAFNHPPDEGHGETSHTLQYNPRDHDKHPVAGVAIIAIIIVYLLVLGPSLALLSPPVPDAGYYIILQIWSWATIAIALVLAIAYYVPQIVHTYRLKRTGSLSLISLTIQVPTYFLMALSMGLQYGSVYETFFENYFRVYSVWCNHLISGLAESGLLGLCAYLAYKKSRRNEEIKRQVEEAERHGSAADEHTPLLIDGLGKGDTAD